MAMEAFNKTVIAIPIHHFLVIFPSLLHCEVKRRPQAYEHIWLTAWVVLGNFITAACAANSEDGS